jgi:hypothetical protein
MIGSGVLASRSRGYTGRTVVRSILVLRLASRGLDADEIARIVAATREPERRR